MKNLSILSDFNIQTTAIAMFGSRKWLYSATW